MAAARAGKELARPLRRLRRGQHQTVAGHYLDDPGRVGAAGCVDDLRDVAEILRSDVRGKDDERPRRMPVRIAEAVRNAAGSMAPLTGLQVAHLVADRAAQHALQAIDALLVAAVAVGRRNVSS